MSQFQTAYINALLSDASYVERVRTGEIEAGDFKARLTETQANYLAENCTVAASHQSPTGGFDAVVWKIKADSELAGASNQDAGRTFVSMRGTQGLPGFNQCGGRVALAQEGTLPLMPIFGTHSEACGRTEIRPFKACPAPAPSTPTRICAAASG